MDRHDLLCYLGIAVVLLTAAVALATRTRYVLAIRVVATCGIVLSLARAWLHFEVPYDFKLFWQVGRDLAAGLDYYAIDPRGDRQPILNPPTTLPLFRAWALLPLRPSALLWFAMNALGILALVPLAHAAIRAQMGPGAPRLPRYKLGILSAALALSCGQGMGLALGQVSVLATAAILSAILAQGVGRPWLAGACLAVATIKVNTMLPFLVLFLRKGDRRTWAGLGLACLGLCLAGGGLSEVPTRVAWTLRTIRATCEPGQVNDYGFAGPAHISMVGIDHALYRLGLRDRGAIRALQLAILAAIGAKLLRGVRSGALPRGASCALVGLYSSIFLYHRIYDLVILVLPLVDLALRAEANPVPRARGPARWGLVVLLALFVNPEGLLILERWSFDLAPWGRVLQAAALPMATWLILLAMAGLGSSPGEAGRYPGIRDGRTSRAARTRGWDRAALSGPSDWQGRSR